jgi:hypothetical protein
MRIFAKTLMLKIFLYTVKMKRHTILILILAFFVNTVYSQEIKFQSTEYQFGTIKEEMGPQKGRFIFTNIGDDTLKIIRVRTSCGCTASDYTKEPILPGKDGFIDATYNPAGRPGKFGKSISVTSNCKVKPNISLTIRGEVIPRPKSKADKYIHTLGNLKFKDIHLSFNDVKNTQSKTDTFEIYNKGKNSISMQFSAVPDFLKAEAKPLVIEPTKEGLIIITYDGSKRNDWGFLINQFTINTNDIEEPEKHLTVSANIIEDFTILTTKQLKKVPVLALDTNNFNFGKVKAGEIVKGSFIIKNIGKDKLFIRKITSSHENLTFSLNNNQIKKNGTAEINFVYDTKGKPSRQHKTLAVITNDPKNSVIVLHIQGTTE